MNNLKPEVRFDINNTGETALPALAALVNICPDASFHGAIDCRHPLGIYNVSIERLTSKIRKCCQRLENYWKAGTNIDDLGKYQLAIRQEVIDYLELTIYAAAEHVDDTEAIARCFFPRAEVFSKSKAVRSLKAELKSARQEISAFANLIKHRQSRIRLFSVEFTHDSVMTCLHALFAEEFSQGAIRPSPILHSGGRQLISVTGFLWEIVLFLFEVSTAISCFVSQMGAIEKHNNAAGMSTAMADTIISLARLPIYSFDEDHPFAKTRFVLNCDKVILPRFDSQIYGSFVRRWTNSTTGGVGKFAAQYEGDGATRTFQMFSPQKLTLQHWS